MSDAVMLCCDYRIVYYAPEAFVRMSRLVCDTRLSDLVREPLAWCDEVRMALNGVCETRHSVSLVVRSTGAIATLYGPASSVTETVAATLLATALRRLDVPNVPPARIIRASMNHKEDAAVVSVPPVFGPVLDLAAWRCVKVDNQIRHKLFVPLMPLADVPLALARTLADLARRYPMPGRIEAAQTLLRGATACTELAVAVVMPGVSRKVWHLIHTEFLDTV